MTTSLLGIAAAIAASGFCASVAIVLQRARRHRAEVAQRLAYFAPGRVPGSSQPWRDGFYDIRDWADGVRGYFEFGGSHHIDFGRIRVPGHRYVKHLLDQNLLPSKYIQEAVILQAHCELLNQTLAHVLASDLCAPQVRQPADRGPLTALALLDPDVQRPAAVKLSVAVRDLAADLADPTRATPPRPDWY